MRRSFDATYEKVDLEIISFGDGQSWRLTLDNYVPAFFMIGSSLLYCFLYNVVFPMTRPKTAAQKERTIRWRQAHNLSLFVYSAICCVGSFWYLIHDDGQLYDWHRLMCTPVEGTILRPLSITFVLSKAWEWWDTAFLVWLGRSPPKFLHLYHHATTFWLFCLTINMPSSEKFGLLLNGGVHTLMYWHYWKPWSKRFVPMITVLQIVQLAFVTYAYTVNAAECGADSSYSRGRNEYPLEFWTAYGMVPVFLAFFIQFFIQRFVLIKKKVGANKHDQKKEL